ncbi:hypothetical protein [Psychromonas sp.]|uniref:hypothetical protein n=1 Tax=Psychromonas sp. TaxID=1884585 RepID=UPI003566576A
MKNMQKFKVFIFVFCSFLFVNGVLAQTTSHLLDSMRFNGEKGRQLDPDEKEEIVFENGRFISTTCNKYNFSDAPYSAPRLETVSTLRRSQQALPMARLYVRGGGWRAGKCNFCMNQGEVVLGYP